MLVELKFLYRNSMAAWPLVRPKVGRIITMKMRYQKVFFITAWFSPDLQSGQFGFIFKKYTVCPRSSDPFYIVTYYIKWVTTPWTHSKQ